MTWEEILERSKNRKPMYGGTFEIHYTDPKHGKMVAYVEAWTETKSAVRKAAIEKAETEQYIPKEWITMVKRYD